MTTPNLPALLAAAREAEAVAPGEWTFDTSTTVLDGAPLGEQIEVCSIDPYLGDDPDEDEVRDIVRALAGHIVAAQPAAVIATVDLAVRAMRMAVAMDVARKWKWPEPLPLPADWRETLAQFRAELAALDEEADRG